MRTCPDCLQVSVILEGYCVQCHRYTQPPLDPMTLGEPLPRMTDGERTLSPTTENSGIIGEAILDDPADRMGAISGEITLNGPCPSSTPETNALKEQVEVLRQMRDEAIEEMGKLAAERNAALVDSSHTLTALHAAQQTIKLLHPALEKCLNALRLRRNIGFPTYDALAMEAEKQGDTAFASILLPK